MKNLYIRLIITCFLIIQSAYPALSWELYDRVIAVVNTIPITESDVSIKIEQMKKLKKSRLKD